MRGRLSSSELMVIGQNLRTVASASRLRTQPPPELSSGLGCTGAHGIRNVYKKLVKATNPTTPRCLQVPSRMWGPWLTDIQLEDSSSRHPFQSPSREGSDPQTMRG